VISATVIQRSKCSNTGKEIVTFELVYPRIIHAEILTHRLFSRNSASSRAIPIYKVVEMVRENMAEPVHWGKNQPGMQAGEELTGFELEAVKDLWCDAALAAADYSEAMANLGAHKQVANRVTEPYQWMKVVLTYTDGENFLWLRLHKDADPTLYALTKAMVDALDARPAFEIHPGEWHVPYVKRIRVGGMLKYYTEVFLEDDEHEIQYLTEEEALAVSASCCAQVSYRLLDMGLDKAKTIYGRLVESEPVHASPFEHQATPMRQQAYVMPMIGVDYEVNYPGKPETWEDGITHVDRDGNFWSGNYQGYIQHRQRIPNNVKKG